MLSICWLGSLAKRWWQLAFLLRSRSDPFSRTTESSGRKILSTSHNSLRFYLESLHVSYWYLSWRTSSVLGFFDFFWLKRIGAAFSGPSSEKKNFSSVRFGGEHMGALVVVLPPTGLELRVQVENLILLFWLLLNK